MKICLINNLYKPFARGGAERIVELTAAGLREAGHDVFIIATKPKKSFTTGKGNDSRIYFINSLYYNLHKVPVFLRLFWHVLDAFDLAVVFNVKRIFKKEKPDLVITHNLKGLSFLLPRLFKKLKISHFHTLHDIQLIHPSGLMIYGEENKIDGIFSKIYTNICKFLFSSPRLIISPSSWLLEMHKERGFFDKSKSVVIPNPVLGSPSNGKCVKMVTDSFVFLYVGQIEQHKGIFLLVEAFKDIPDRKVVLRIAGSGSASSRLLEEIKRCGNIEYLGQKKAAEISVLMDVADCLVVPSLCYENSPTVIYEASSRGLFVLASAIGGGRELVGVLGGGLFLPEKRQLLEKLDYAIKNSETIKISGEISKVKIKEYYLENYIRLLDRLIADIVR